MRVVASWTLTLVFGSAFGQQGLLPAIQAKGDTLVLAKVVSIEPGCTVTETDSSSSQSRSQDLLYKAVVLQCLDTFMGTASDSMTVLVPASEVDFADHVANPGPGPHGGSGRGPLNGLLPGDISVWVVQAPDKNQLFTPVYGYPNLVNGARTLHLSSKSTEFKAMWAVPPILIAGRTLMSGPGPREVPAYDHDLNGPLRYMDVVGRSVVENSHLPQKHPYDLDSPLRLSELRDSVLPGNWASESAQPVVPRDVMVKWFEERVAADWPTDEVDRLNLTASQMVWEGAKPLEPTFLALIRKLGRKSLVVNLPPITDENFFVEECGDDSVRFACEAFQHVRQTKNLNPRVGRAAAKWLELMMKGGDPAVEAKNAGLAGNILWWLADSLDRKDFVTDWVKPSVETLEKARRTAINLPG